MIIYHSKNNIAGYAGAHKYYSPVFLQQFVSKTSTISGGQTVSLGGVGASASAGDITSLGNALASLSGVSVTGDIGALSASSVLTVSLSGVEATTAPGVFVVTGGATVSISGVSASGSVGTITASIPSGITIQTPTHNIYTIEHEDRIYLVLEENRTLLVQ